MATRTVFIRTAAIAVVFASSFGTGAGAAIGQADPPALTMEGVIAGTSTRAPGPHLNAGLPTSLVFTVANSGGETLTDLALLDTTLGEIECVATSLAPGEFTSCARDFEVVRGRYRSSTFATAIAPDGSVVSQSFRVGYYGRKIDWVAALDLEIVFDAGPLRWPGPTLSAGDPLILTFRLLNSGTVPLRDLKVRRPLGFSVTCPARTVDPGHTIDCTGVGTVIEGRYKGKAVFSAWDDRGTKVQERRLIHYVGEERVLTAEFTTEVVANNQPAGEAPGPLVEAKTWVQWWVTVSNVGEDDLWGIYAWDSEVGKLRCNAFHIAPGEAARCRLKAKATTGPMVGQIDLSVWASDGRQITSRIERHALGFHQGAGLMIETYVDGFDADRHAGPRRVVGLPIELTYVVSNIGDETVKSIRVSDDLFGRIDCPRRRLASGASMTCTHSTITELGWWETTGSVRGRGASQVVTASDKTFWHVRTLARVSVIELDVTIGGHATNAGRDPTFTVGQEVEIVYRAFNAGNSPLWSMEIRDPQVPFSDMACTGDLNPSPGESLVCRAIIVIEAGSHWEDIEAVGWNSDGTRIVGKTRSVTSVRSAPRSMGPQPRARSGGSHAEHRSRRRYRHHWRASHRPPRGRS